MERAVRNLTAQGLQSGILLYDRENPVLQTGLREALLLCDDGELLKELRGKGFYTAGCSHAFNESERFDGAAFVVQEPDLVDPDSYEKMYERQAGLPWTILRTPRCVVREFTVDDLDQIYSLYDGQARRFITPPSEDRERERDILRAYIDRIYPFYGFGYWAVTAGSGKALSAYGTKDSPEKEKHSLSLNGTTGLPAGDGELIGRVGFAPLTARQEREAVELGMRGYDERSSGFDADFGFLIRQDCRGLGIASEVSRALLEYGFTELGFTCVRADARLENGASLRLLRSLGFSCIGTRDKRQIFCLKRKA